VTDKSVTATTAWNTLWNTQLLYVTDNHCDDSVKHSLKHSVIVRDRQVTVTTAWNTQWDNKLLYVTDKSLRLQRETLSETLSYCTWQRTHCDDSVMSCHCNDSVKQSLKHWVMARDRQVTTMTAWNTVWNTQLLYVTDKSLRRQRETLYETLSYCTWLTATTAWYTLWNNHCHYLIRSTLLYFASFAPVFTME